jgi:HJR/Mrr/RecB family endonuclease
MEYVKFSGLLKEIADNYSSIDLAMYLKERLKIQDYKAKELAERIDRSFSLEAIAEMKERSLEFARSDRSEERDDGLKFNIYALDSISGKEFEYFLKWLFEEMEYAVELTKITADSGVDLVVRKNDEKVAVQAKRYSRNTRVSNAVILKTHGGKDVYGCSRSVVITTSFFTKHAIKDAEKLGIELWDRDTLSSKIDEINQKIRDSKQRIEFPPYQGTLLKSLLALGRTGVFVVERKDHDKYDVHRHGIKYPILSFQVRGLSTVTRCVFRIAKNEPVGEYEGRALIRSDRHYRYGPDEESAYRQIANYLSQFV